MATTGEVDVGAEGLRSRGTRSLTEGTLRASRHQRGMIDVTFVVIYTDGDVARGAAKPGPKKLHHRMRDEWDSLFWIFLAFAVLYLTNFGSTVVFNDRVRP